MLFHTSYEVHGDGSPVVMIHGLGMNRAMWQWQIDELSPHYKLITYDLLGHGESDKPPAPYTMPQMVAQVADLMDETCIERAAIVGFSLGGLIAQAFALEYSDRVSAIAILNSGHARSEESRDAIMQRVRQAEDGGPAATVDEALQRWFSDDFAAKSPQVLDMVRDWILANDPDVYPAVYRLLAVADLGLEDAIAGIRCPALVVTGEEDFGNSVEMAREMAVKIPHSELTILPGLRHMALAEDPAQMNRILLDFFARHIDNKE